MKFDFIIGNPPYQNSANGQSTRDEPIYHYFVQEAYKNADIVELITPARFLFNAGQTPKSWNRQMLSDEHLKVLFYEPRSGNVFVNTDIKGGVAITYRNANKQFDPIGIFTPYDELNEINKKVFEQSKGNSLSEIISSQGIARFSKQFYTDFPNAFQMIGHGTGDKIVSSELEKFPDVFHKELPKDGKSYIKLLGRVNNQREYRYINRTYLQKTDFFDVWKVLLPEANGRGELGEKLSEPIIEGPGVCGTDTFICIGKFDTKREANAALKYIKTKFCRVLLATLKVTQHASRNVWKYVPSQNFTINSDINWTDSIHGIDLQLYDKYKLSNAHITFIESNVKEMN